MKNEILGEKNNMPMLALGVCVCVCRDSDGGSFNVFLP